MGMGANGLTSAPPVLPTGYLPVIDPGAFPAGGYRAGEVNDFAENAKALYDSREPAKMLANLEGITIEAAFILKDLHR